jgi:hypothetical protein
MADIKTNKVDATRRQLDAAIRMFFAKEDALAIHTLASAAYRILRDLAEGTGNSKFHESVKSMIKPGKEKKFWAAMNKFANFLKHADSDPDGILEIKEEVNDMTIAIACLYWESLGNQLTPEMHGYMTWHVVINPDLFLDDAPAKKLLSQRDFDSLRALPRAEQIELGKQIYFSILNPDLSSPK